MPNSLHQHWKKTKDDLAKSAAEMKKTGGNSKPIDTALKSFDGGFGPLLDKVGDAYKAKKDADVKKQAAAAGKIAGTYKTTIDAIPYQCRVEAGFRLSHITKVLKELETKGTTATDYFK
jgi:hypothetical protein